MITLGSFPFPQETTLLQVSQIEAKSKVRKEIRLRSMLTGKTEASLQQILSDLSNAVESFDHQQILLSISTGRFYQGRQRFFQVTPFPQESLAWAELLLLTHDRYERSIAQHPYDLDTQNGIADFSLVNQGNWPAPVQVLVTSIQPMNTVYLTFHDGIFTVNAEIPANETLVIDTENRKVMLGDNNLYSFSNEVFPTLAPGSNLLTVHVEPISADAHCTVLFRDFWV